MDLAQNFVEFFPDGFLVVTGFRFQVNIFVTGYRFQVEAFNLKPVT